LKLGAVLPRLTNAINLSMSGVCGSAAGVEKRGAGSGPAGKMEFKKLKVDALRLMADLVLREASHRDELMAAALRRIDVVAEGRYGENRPDVRLTLALSASVEAAVDCRLPGPGASLSMLTDAVDELVTSAERIFDDRHNTIEMLREIRAALSREISKARRRGLPYRTVDVSLTASEAGSHDLPAVMITLEVIGPLLDLEQVKLNAESVEDVVLGFAEIREKQEQRRAMRDHLASVGADVAIDSVTLAALQDAGITPSKAVEDLRAVKIGIIALDARYGQLVLYVQDGVVTGNVPLGDGMRWQEGRLIVPTARGISFEGANGKPLKQLLRHDYFADAARISRASKIGDTDWVYVQTQPVALRLSEERKAA
jgi:hypothetical protein